MTTMHAPKPQQQPRGTPQQALKSSTAAIVTPVTQQPAEQGMFLLDPQDPGPSGEEAYGAIVSAPKSALPAEMPPDNRTSVQKYLDEVAPTMMVGRMIKFTKPGEFKTPDDDAVISPDTDFIVLADQTQIGWIKFNGEGVPPDREMGLLYDGFVMPARTMLGDNDEPQWKIGLNQLPEDPWKHQMNLVLQQSGTDELFTFSTMSKVGRRAIGSLLRQYDRMQKSHPDMYPIVRLKVGGFNHRDERVGWVETPVLAIVGKHPKDSAAKPDSSPAADFDDFTAF